MGWFGFGRRKARAAAPVMDHQPETAPSVEASEAVVEPAAPEPEPAVDALAEPAPAEAEPVAEAPPPPPTPDEALRLMVEGNAAFLRGESNLGHVRADDLGVLQDGQHPIATVVGCADSRTPPTILFNQGFGRLFSIRVAGNTVDRRGLASIVYAVKHLNCPLVVVMGHTGCGAVAAAEAVVDDRAPLDPSLEEMIVPIIPAVLTARRSDAKDMAVAAVEENARRVAAKLLTADTAVAEAVEAGRLKVVAAVKQMNSGEVRFLDLEITPEAPAVEPRPAERELEPA